SDGNAVAPGEYTFRVEGSLRWKNRVVYTVGIDIGKGVITAEASPEYFYEGSGDQPALDERAVENAMIGTVTVRSEPAA
ncbi:MAG: hypothetical protein FWE80_10420, partial [Oscillospiraceae bacterium]|nr:hypothetical protein [Oscillospiraceae bacterium]